MEEDRLPLPPVASEEIEYSEDATGREVYRYVIHTDWEVVPSS